MKLSAVTILSACFFVLLLLFPSTFSARILGIVPTPSYSHQVAFQPLWKELSLRGHQVTVITTNPIRDQSLKNLTEIDLSSIYEAWNKIDVNKMSEIGLFGFLDLLKNLGDKIMEVVIEHPEVQKLIKNEKQVYDVALVETIWPGVAAFAVRFKCPMIQIFSIDAYSLIYHLIGNPSHPVLYPDINLPFTGKLSFFERLISTVFALATDTFFKNKIYPSQDLIVKKYFGHSIPPVEELVRNASLTFVNTDFVFHPIRPLLPSVIPIGGGTHLTSPKPLPKDIKNILDTADKGVIYFSLGSNVKSFLLSADIRKVFLETFAELPYTVFWKFEQKDLLGKPDNVFISKWFPQQDIFRHPNIKLFISQGGLQSRDEAVHNHIPIIGIPFFGDQANNVKRIENMGIGLGLDIKTIDKKALKDAILEIMNNSKYRNKVKELAELARDQPMTGLERGVWWTEYVIRHKGAKHLRSPAIDLPDYQYYLLDVIGFCLLIVSIVIYVLIKLTKLVFKFVRYLLPKSKVKTQ